LFWNSEDVIEPTLFQKRGRFSSLFPKNRCSRTIYHAWFRTNKKGRAESGYSVGTTRYYKWYKEERPSLFECLAYQKLSGSIAADFIPKFRSSIEIDIYNKVIANRKQLGDLISPGDTKYPIYYKITGVGHWFTFTLRPPKFWRDGNEESSTRESAVFFPSALIRDTAYCCLCSSLHYWLYQARTNCRDFNPSDFAFMPLPESASNGVVEFPKLAMSVMERLSKNSEIGEANYAVGGAVRFEKFRPRLTKDLLDQIDRILGRLYGLSDSEVDFVINYDIKYRMGDNAEEAE
jgi:hypothetical protein